MKTTNNRKAGSDSSKKSVSFLGWIVTFLSIATIILAASFYFPLFQTSNGGVVMANTGIAYLISLVSLASIVAAGYFLRNRSDKTLMIFSSFSSLAIIISCCVFFTVPKLFFAQKSEVSVYPGIGTVLYFVAIAGLLAQWISLFAYRKIKK